MDADEVIGWAAYDLLQDTDKKDYLMQQVRQEKTASGEYTASEEAELIKAAFAAMGQRNGK